LATLQQKLAVQEGLRQADHDYADQVASAHTAQAEAREQALRAEVARARAEALSQVRLEHDQDIAAVRELLRKAQGQLSEQKAASDAQALETGRLLHAARRTAEVREAYTKTVESADVERETKLVAEAERRHAEALATPEARLT